MKPRAWVALVIGLVLIGSAGSFLSRIRHVQKVAAPGVKVVAQALTNELGKVVATNAVFLPEKVGSITSVPGWISSVEVATLPKDTIFGRRFYEWPDGFPLQLSVVLMGVDRTSIHRPEACLTGQGWRMDTDEYLAVPMEKPHAYDLQVRRIGVTGRMQKDKQVVERRGYYTFWFVAADELTPDHRRRMWSSARHMISTGELKRWAYVSCFVTFEPGMEHQAWSRVSHFITGSVPQFQLMAPGENPAALAPGSLSQR